MSWCPCLLTAYHPRGGQTSVLRVHQPASRGECCCGCEQMGSMPGGCARAGCTGREARRRTETNPTSWRETSPVNCSTRRTTSQVRGHKLKSAQDLWSTITCARETKKFSLFWVSMLLLNEGLSMVPCLIHQVPDLYLNHQHGVLDRAWLICFNLIDSLKNSYQLAPCCT